MTDELLTLAEFAIALVGFTGIVVVLGRDGQWDPIDRFRVFNALVLSLGPAFMALLPVGLIGVGMDERATWRLCSALVALLGATLVAYSTWWGRSLDDASRRQLTAPVRWLMIGLNALAVIVQLLNASGLWLEPQGGLYFLGLVVLLLTSAIAFVRTVFVRRPGGS